MSFPQDHASSPDAGPTESGRHFSQLCVAAFLGIALSIGVFLIVHRAEHDRVQRTFRAEAHKLGQNLGMSLARYRETLHTLRDVFTASEEVNFGEFRSAAADLRRRHPGIQTLAWLPHVPRDQRPALEIRARKEVRPDFVISENSQPTAGAAPVLVPAPERGDYLPALFVEPPAGNESILGFDQFTGLHQKAIAHARDSGEMAATWRVTLGGDVPGWLLLLPVYSPGTPPRTVEERRQRFRGCLEGSFRLGDLVTTTIDRAERRAMEVLLVDHTPASTEPYLIHFAGDTIRLAPPPSEADFLAGESISVKLPLAGREWVALFRPSAFWLKEQTTKYSYAFLVGGLLLTGLLVYVLRGAQRRTSRVRELVDQRTAELRATQTALREDIRERAAAERALRASDERYRAFIANSREAIWRFEIDPPVKLDQPEDTVIDLIFQTARLAEGNDALARQYGYERGEELIGKRLDELMPRSDPANVEHLRTYARSGFRLENAESHELDREGRLRIFENNLIGIIENGYLHRTWGTLRDVTEQREAERTRRESEARLRLALAAADLGTWEWNATTRQLLFSEGTERIFGLAPGSFDSKPETGNAFIHPEDRERVTEGVRRALRERAECNIEHRIIRPDGSLRWIVARGDVIEDENGQATRILGAMMDVTEDHQRAEEKALLEKKLQETQKLESLGILAGGIAHDFNNLLTGVLGNASLARMDLPPGSPAHQSLEAIETVAQRAADLCKQMLAYSGKGRFIVHRLDLSALVQETAELIQVSISKNVVLKFALSDSLPAIAADATQMRQIIMNLVINASDAIGDARGQITLSTGVVHADQAYLANTYLSPELPEGKYVYLEVSDNGCGMDAETRGRIFDPFFTTKFTGRGLGLAAVLGIVRGHSGALRVYSEPGNGSTFKLLLPAVAGPAESEPRSGRPALGWRGSGTVLVVDDEEAVRNVTARMLQAWGFQTETACNGREAVAAFREDPERFVAVLLDLTMPEMDGTATFTELRRIRPGVSVLLMSGFNEQDAVSRFAGKGLAGFLQKPFKSEALQARLRSMLDTPTLG